MTFIKSEKAPPALTPWAERAAKLFLSEHPEQTAIQVILYGSLSKTGVGHGTDRVLREVLASVDNKIIYAQEDPEDMGHPNTMDFFAYQAKPKPATSGWSR